MNAKRERLNLIAKLNLGKFAELETWLKKGRRLPRGGLQGAILDRNWRLAELFLAHADEVHQFELDASLLAAVERKNEKLALRLLGLGANPDHKGDIYGRASLALAEQFKMKVLSSALRKIGASREATQESPLKKYHSIMLPKSMRVQERKINPATKDSLQRPVLGKNVRSTQPSGIGVLAKAITRSKLSRFPLAMRNCIELVTRQTSIPPTCDPDIDDACFFFPSVAGLQTTRSILNKLDAIRKVTTAKFQSSETITVLRTYVKQHGVGLVVVRATDISGITRILGTCGPRYAITSGWLDMKLSELHQVQPFELVECGPQTLGGMFTGPVKNPELIAQALLEMSPLVSDAGGDDPVRKLAKALKKKRTFSIGWD